jgi:methionyl-tRNA formyltransferase
MKRVILAGSVTSTFWTLKKLKEHNFDILTVFGFEPSNEKSVSGYVNMRRYCIDHDIPYYGYQKIDSEEIENILRTLQPDLFFVVGLSQLIPGNLLQIAKYGNIGFHPTALPYGRGRAPLAWLILEGQNGAATFFLMSTGVDDGPIFIQKDFAIDISDTALTVEAKMLTALGEALDDWLPKLISGEWNPLPQDESKVSFFGKRGPDDGLINWSDSACNIDKLIRASTTPHPGSFTFLKGEKITVLKSRIENNLRIKGVIGNVLLAFPDVAEFLIQTGKGLIWISEVFQGEVEVDLKVGQHLGFYVDLELSKLKQELAQIKKKLDL